MASPRDLRPLPRLLPQTPLNQRFAAWVAAAAAGAVVAGLGGLLSRWCASPTLGWGVALVSAALGAASAAGSDEPGDEEARGWIAGGALAALLIPAVLRLLGLGLASAGQLDEPLGGAGQAAFVLAQAGLLAAAAAAAWTKAARPGGRVSGALAAAAALAVSFSFRLVEPAVAIAGAALAALAAAEAAERPWRRRASQPLRFRLFAAAGGAGLLLAFAAPGLLRDVWMARLHAAYPGGDYLSFADDGRHVWAAFRFSTGDPAPLRDGALEALDGRSVRVAVRALLGQGPGPGALLVVSPPEGAPVFSALADGAAAAVERLSPAQEAAIEALSSRQWRAGLPDAETFKAGTALVFVPRPYRALEARRLAGPAALRRLRGRLAAPAAVGVYLPAGAPLGAPAAIAARAAAVFGHARVADLPRGTLIVASTSEVEIDPRALFARLPETARAANPGGDAELAGALLWRASPSAK